MRVQFVGQQEAQAIVLAEIVRRARYPGALQVVRRCAQNATVVGCERERHQR
ncbi:hypothetical protein D3C71_1252830 [compost metagenome]